MKLSTIYWGLLLVGCLSIQSSPLYAGPVRGTIKFTQQRDQPPKIGGYWTIRNHELKPAPPFESQKQHMVITIDGSGLKQGSSNDPRVILSDGRFIPPLIAVRPNTTLTFENKDWLMHIMEPTSGRFMKPQEVNPGEIIHHKFETLGTYHVHSSEVAHMKLTVFVTDKARIALPDRNGVFQFENMRPGTYNLQVWYRGKWIHSQSVTVRSSRTQLDIVLPVQKD